jgi:adenylate cyclase class IV
MSKIEVEYRGILNKKKFGELNVFLKKNGKFIEERDRFSLIYFPRGKEKFKVSRSPLDLRVRITNKKPELVLKYGKSSGNDARKEFSFPVESDQFEEMTEFLFILGYYYGVLQATKSYFYMYEGIEFALVDVPGFGYYFEAEILTGSKSVKNADKKIMSACDELGLDVLNDRDFWKLLEDLSDRPGFRFNLKNQKFSDIRKRFVGYF